MNSQGSPPTQRHMLIKSHALPVDESVNNSKPLVDSRFPTRDNDTQVSAATTSTKLVTEFVCKSYPEGLKHLKQSLCELSELMPMIMALASTFSAVSIQISKELSEIEAGIFKDTVGGDVRTRIPLFQLADSAKTNASTISAKSSSQKRTLDYFAQVNGCTASSLKKRMKKDTAGLKSCNHHNHRISLLPESRKINQASIHVNLGLSTFGIPSTSPTNFILPYIPFPISAFPDALAPTNVLSNANIGPGIEDHEVSSPATEVKTDNQTAQVVTSKFFEVGAEVLGQQHILARPNEM